MVQAAVGAAQGGVSLATRVSYAMRQRREVPLQPHPRTGSRAAWAALLVPAVRKHAWKQTALPKLPLDSRHFIKPFCMWYRPYAVLDLRLAVINCRDDRWIPTPMQNSNRPQKNGPPREQAKTPFNRISRTTKKRHTLGCTALKVIG